MKISAPTIYAWLRENMDGSVVTDYAGAYGEPGYHLSGETPLFLIGNWWIPHTRNTPELRSWPDKYPRLFAQLESQGVEWAFYDEWTVDYDNDKAYRTSADSYSWESSIAWTEGGDMLTPDDDFESWLEYALEDRHALNRTQVPDLDRKLREAGFTRVPEDGDAFESGWHPGQDDDPKVVEAELLGEYGPDTQIVFALVENSQFYTRWAVYHRQPESEDE